MNGTTERPDAATFQAALPSGWTVAIYHRTGDTPRGYVVRASHRLYGEATIGPKARLVPADVDMLRGRVRDVEAPPLTYSQWLAVGERQSFELPEDARGRKAAMVAAHGYDWEKVQVLGRALRLLATCIERGDVEPSDVAQALFNRDTYNVNCPVVVASGYGEDVGELMALLGQAAEAYGYEAPNVNAPQPERAAAPPPKRLNDGRLLSSYCMSALTRAYYDRVRARESFKISEDDTQARGWQDFAAWHGEDYMYQAPDGRRYLTDADEPANAVDVTDVPLQYEDEVVG